MPAYRFASPEKLVEIVIRQKRGQHIGAYSVCSSNRHVLEACFRFAREHPHLLLIETTCNQVNPFDGYTGLTPKEFTQFITSLAGEAQFPLSQLILGGDHLGPYPWRKEKAADALAKSAQMVQAYVACGYRKIHIDTSIPCADDPTGNFDRRIAAHRAAMLCRISEREAEKNPEVPLPVYVIGSEVPAPGGAKENGTKKTIQVTEPDEAAETLEIFESEFRTAKIMNAWERVIAMVVQPGIEFGDDGIQPYNPNKTNGLVSFISQCQNIVFESHSTDYQDLNALHQLVADQFAFLKVGPALTFAFREALLALECIEREWLGLGQKIELSHLRETILHAMESQPDFWQDYYSGSGGEIAFKKIFSLSDRVRYYWNQPEVQAAMNTLMENLRDNPPPYTLISQYLPEIHKIKRKSNFYPMELVWEKIAYVLTAYHTACRPF
jgi:D-tagatose-1,6-bisphosphate aldolase subunit GatZ/KbaZ